MSSVRPDSGITMDFSESSLGGVDTPDTGLGMDITRLGEPKKQFNHLYGDSTKSTSNAQFDYLYDTAKVSTANDDSSELKPGANEELEKESTAVDDVSSETADAVADLTPSENIQKALANISRLRSQSVQLESRAPKSSSQELAGWRRASSSLLTRSQSIYSIVADAVVENMPTSELAEKIKPRKQSYSNAEGVLLRGDKGKARRKSAMSAGSSHASSLPVSNEWTKCFQVPYAPRHKPTKIVRASIAPPKIGKLGSDNELDRNNISRPETSTTERPWRQASSYYRKQGSNTGRVEIHYEKCLPKDHWLEMKPKRFTHNHKHGNPFELRKPHSKHELNTSKSNVKKEAFVWENPHQIWLMEKTHMD